MIAFDQYAKVKDNYCLGYFGPELSYVVELIQARTDLESAFPGIKIYISCRDDHAARLVKHERVIPVSQLKLLKEEFAYIRDLKHDGKMTPARIVLHESGVSTYKMED